MANLDKQLATSSLPPEAIHAPEYSVEHRDIIEVLRGLPTNKTAPGFGGQDYPYEDANISVVMIDPKNPTIPLRFSQTFIEPNHVPKKDLTKIIGQPLREISDLIIVRDKSGNIVDQLFPLILEQVEDEHGKSVWMPGDGNHRQYEYLMDSEQQPFRAVLISKVPPKHQPAYWPVRLSEIEIKPMPLEVENRRRLKPGFNALNYKQNRPFFPLLGSPESRSSNEERLKVTSLHQYVSREPHIPAQIVTQIRDKFAGNYAPLPSNSCLEPIIGEPSINGCVDIHGVTDSLRVAEFSTRIDDNAGENLFLTVREREEYLRHATRASAIITATEAKAINQRPTSVLDGEFFIEGDSPDLLSQFQVKGSKNPNAPHLKDVEIKTIPDCPLSFLVLTLEGGNQIPIQISSNAPNEIMYSVRDYLGYISFAYNYFPSQGIKLLSIPIREQLPLEYEKILDTNTIKTTNIWGLNSSIPRRVNFVDVQYNVTRFHGQSVTAASIQNYSRAELYGREVDNYIGGAFFYDLKTSAVAIVAQLLSGHMFPRKDISDYSVLLERMFDPVNGEVLVVPRLSIEYQNKLQPRLSNPADSINLEYTNTVTPDLVISNVKNVVAIPALEVIKMMTELKLDYETIGHLGTIFRQGGLFWYHRPEHYFRWSA